MNVDALEAVPLPSPTPIAQPAIPDDYAPHRGEGTPLVIDNGATTVRFGFATSDAPHDGLNTVAKYKERKTNRPMLLFGDAVELESAAKPQIRTPWEGDVLLNFDALEHVLDYAFIQLGIDADTVEHPVLMTERLCSPLHSRTLTSELMFELYSVPSLVYCVDSVMSFYQNHLPTKGQPFSADGIVLSFNHSSTSVIPILHGQSLMNSAKRIPFGAQQASEYLLKLVQMKYPTFPSRVTPPQATWMLRNMCSFSAEYTERLRKLKNPLELRSVERVVQFPYTVPTENEKTEEEVARLTEKRREQGRRLQETQAKIRLEQAAQNEATLQALLELRDRKATDGKRDWLNALKEEDIEDEAELEQSIKKLEKTIKAAKKKETGEADVAEEPATNLLDVPDEDLDEAQLKEKRQQRLNKANYDARMRAQREKEREKDERERALKMDDAARERDFSGWAGKLRRDHEALITKLKGRARRRLELTDRKSAATQARMKNIANLAADERGGKKKRKTGGEDMFGADDADWEAYRKINLQVASSDEEDELQQLQEIEEKLLAHDPTFTVENTHAVMASQRSALLTAFKPDYDESDFAGKAKIHLSTERWRACEAWFSPSMAGVDSAGIGEVIQNILAGFSDSDRGKLVQNVFTTGGPSQLPGLSERLHATLRPILPPEVPLNIGQAANPVIDAWKGMAAFARTDEFERVGITRAEYDEWGGERVKRWWGGNWNSSVPL